ncbi:MAG: hypothetical protein ACOZNI_35085 [Myxococcota bacterium]
MLALIAATAFAETRFDTAIQRVEQMVWDEDVRRMVARHGLDVVNVTWEDTGRSKGSAWGPNISDMTIGVRDARGALHPMPVVRFDNFHDTTADLRSDRFWLRVGNEDGGRLRSVTLADVLQETRSFLSDPGSWRGRRSSLWADRDEDVLVSAQACFLPIPRSGEATFTPVLYNYQSYADNPAVLTIVATREGTSMQVVENEGGYLSEVLWFNEDGERAPFTATRLSDFRAQGGDATSTGHEKGLDMVLVIQVPLKQKAPPPRHDLWGAGGAWEMEESAPMAAASKSADSDVEQAVIGHGETEGPHKEIADLDIERDPRFPVRVTVQFYKATSTGEVTDADIRDIRRQIDRVYADASYVGSLVSDGYTGRSTEWVTPRRVDPSPTAVWADPYWSWHTAD